MRIFQKTYIIISIINSNLNTIKFIRIELSNIKKQRITDINAFFKSSVNEIAFYS